MRRATGLLAVFACALALAGGGCVILEQLGLASSGPVFGHHNHGEKEELECVNCHATYAKADGAGMPKRKVCILCHEGIDEEKPAEEKIARLFGEDVKWKRVTEVPEDVIFSHKVHHDAKVGCGECHKGIEQSTRVSASLRVDMRGCVECHARQPLEGEISTAPPPAPAGGAYTAKRATREAQVANECAVCHRQIRKETPPPSHEFVAEGRPPRDHRSLWKQIHGQAVKTQSGRTKDRCDLCHQESFCSDCHREEAPSSHTGFWKDRGHGVAVGIDRSKCATCHQSDACDRCHRETAPRSHVGAWGSPRDNHCLSCHGLNRGEGCGMCHRGAPSHTLAEPKPSWHSAGMNCRQCHYPPPHADNGMDCNACHR